MEWNNESFSDDEEESNIDTASELDHVLCLVDARENMFQMNSDGETYFCMAMKVIHKILRTKIINSDKNLVGVTMFGTQNKTSPDSPHDNIYNLINLDIPSASSIDVIEKLSKPAVSSAQDSQNDGVFDESQDDSLLDTNTDLPQAPACLKNATFFSLFGDSLPPDATCPFKAALWSCTQSFVRNAGTAASTKRVFLFTNDDDPLRDAFDEQDRAVQVARDASDSGVDIQLFPMGQNFNVSKFYHRILVVDADEDLGSKVIRCSDIGALNTIVHKKIHRKRTLARLSLIFSSPGEEDRDDIPTVAIQMKLVITTAATKTSAVQLDANSNQIVKAQTKYLCGDTGNYLDEYDIRTYMEVGGHNERAYMTKGEVNSMKCWGSPGITILGFVDESWMKPWYFVRSPYFLYPDEATVKGSTLAASCLLTTLLKQNKIGIARFVRTTSAAPVLMALIPQKEEISKEGLQVSPPGFHALVLPFRDDLRELPHVPLTTTERPEGDEAAEEEEQTTQGDGSLANRLYSAQLAKSVTSLVRDSVNIDKSALYDIPNPVLQKQWHMLQGLALSNGSSSSSSSSFGGQGSGVPSWNEKKDDLLQPNRKAWGSKYHLSVGFMDALPFGGLTSGTSPKKKAPAAKRKPKASEGDGLVDSDGEGGTVQKKRAKPTVVEHSEEDWAVFAADGKIESQTIPSLKAYLKKHGLSTTGKKSELVERIYDLLGA